MVEDRGPGESSDQTFGPAGDQPGVTPEDVGEDALGGDPVDAGDVELRPVEDVDPPPAQEDDSMPRVNRDLVDDPEDIVQTLRDVSGEDIEVVSEEDVQVVAEERAVQAEDAAAAGAGESSGTDEDAEPAVDRVPADESTSYLSDADATPGSGDDAGSPTEIRASADVFVDRRRGFLPRLGRRSAIALAVLAGLLFLLAGGAAYATYDFSERYEGRILPGTTIGGVDVGGLRYESAVGLVQASIAPELNREIRLVAEGKAWKVTPKELGARSNAGNVVRAALQASRSTTFIDKMKMRVLGDRLGFARGVAIRYPRRQAHGFVEGMAASYDRDPVDATIDYSSGWVEVVPERAGRKVQVATTHRALMRALRSGDKRVQVAVQTLQPETTTAAFDQVLLLRIGENKLYLYQDGRITHEWPVATGQPEYPTPTGIYSITLKRYMPTWVNPDPTGWGADMPESIPPGPGNPLGVRALNWSADAIRFHGTSATYSLGYNASHGCVRLSNDDVIQLYDLVDVGTPIVSAVVAPLRPLYSSSAPDPTVVPD